MYKLKSGLMLTPFLTLLILFSSLGSLVYLGMVFFAIIADVETEARPSQADFPLTSRRIDWLQLVHLIHANACNVSAGITRETGHPCSRARIPRHLVTRIRVSSLISLVFHACISPLFFSFSVVLSFFSAYAVC
jgi:hypothetical protein